MARISDPLPNFPKISYEKIQADLNLEYRDMESGYNTAKSFREKNWNEYSFQPYGNEQKNASKVVDSTIYNAVEWMLPTLMRPFIETEELMKFKPAGPDLEAIISAGVNRELLDYQIRRKEKYYLNLYDNMKQMLVGGFGYFKAVWVKKNPEKGEPVDRAGFRSINPDSIRYDWEAKSFYDSHVVTHDEEWTQSQVRGMLGEPGVMDDKLKVILETPGRSEKDPDLTNEQKARKNWVGGMSTPSSETLTRYKRREQWTEYDIDGDGFNECIMAVFIDDQLVQVILNPHKFGEHPFVISECVRDPNGNPASGQAAVLSEIQQFRTGILRMVSDNLNSQQNGIYEVDRMHVNSAGMQLIRRAAPGSRTPVPVTKAGSINPLTPAPLAPHALTAWEMLAVEGENRGGNTRYSQGLDSKSLNQTATGIVTITNRSELRMWELAQRFAEATFKPLVRKLIALNQQYLPKQSLQVQFGIQVDDPKVIAQAEKTGKRTEIPVGEWITLSKDDIGGFFTIELDVQVGSERQEQINNMLQYLQYVAPFVGQGVPPELVTTAAIELAKKMGLPKLQAHYGGSYVGSRGVSAPLVGGAQQAGGREVGAGTPDGVAGESGTRTGGTGAEQNGIIPGVSA